jgi:hypothetical protein
MYGLRIRSRARTKYRKTMIALWIMEMIKVVTSYPCGPPVAGMTEFINSGISCTCVDVDSATCSDIDAEYVSITHATGDHIICIS